MTIREADNLFKEKTPLLKAKRFYLKDEGAKRTFVVTVLNIKEIGLNDFQVFAVLQVESPERETWEININSLDMFFTPLN